MFKLFFCVLKLLEVNKSSNQSMLINVNRGCKGALSGRYLEQLKYQVKKYKFL